MMAADGKHKKIRGAKGGETQRAPVESPDSLVSTASARILDLISEGEIFGFVNADGASGFLRDVYLDETPVANADGALNFKNVQIDSRVGTQTQDYMQGFPSVESEIGIGVELTAATPFIRAINNTQLNAIRVLLSVNALAFTDTATGDVKGHKIEYAIDLKIDAGAYVEVFKSAFVGKTTTKYQRSHRVDLPPATTSWTLKVRRLTADTTESHIQDTTTIDSFTEIIDVRFRYPMSALVGVIVDASQFRSIPTRGYYIKGRLIRIPSNYNPITRVYTGTWNGTFQTAWSNNPAWIFFDIVTNARYGLGHIVSDAQVDKWSLYAIGQYCDGFVPTGALKRATATTGSVTLSSSSTDNSYNRTTGSFLTDGFLASDEVNATGFAIAGNNGRGVVKTVTALKMILEPDHALATGTAAAARTIVTQDPTEPRFATSLFLQRQEDAYKVIQDMTSLFRGISYWAGGAIVPVCDMPADPVYVYTNANVIEGKFTYQGSGRRARHTVALVTWSDPTDFGRQKVEYVSDEEGIARYGIQQTQVSALGCVSQGMARRLGKWILTSEMLETDTVSFEVGLEGTLAAPGQIIRVADRARAGRRIGGRVKQFIGSTSIKVDAMPSPPPAVGDTLTVTRASGVTVDRAITAVDLALNNITVSPGWATVPADYPVAGSAWAVESAALVTQLYRVISVTEAKSDDKIAFSLNCLQHEPQKFDSVELGTRIAPRQITGIASNVQLPPTALTLTFAPRAGAVLASTVLTAGWVAAAGAIAYEIQWRPQNGEWTGSRRVTGLSAQFDTAFGGQYQFKVSAIGPLYIRSAPVVSAIVTVPDQTMQPTSVSAASSAAAAAQASADSANAALADIASDSLLTPGEKPVVIQNRDDIVNEQAGIDAQATSYAITTEKTTYDTAVSALITYLATLTSATLWSDLAGKTTIVGATFRTKFLDVYNSRQVLLNKIYALAKTKADAAQAAADAAQASATTANADLANIASDSLLTPDEKPRVILDRDEITNGQAGIDAQATTYLVTTEKTTYDNAVSALVSYLATLTTPVLWTNLGGNTTIVGATFRTKFLDVYNARTALLQKIADVVTFGNTGGNGSNLLWDEYSRYADSTLPVFSVLNGAITPTYDAANKAVGIGGSISVTTQGTNTSEGFHLGASSGDYNLPLLPGKYIFSAYVRASVAGHLVRLSFRENSVPSYIAATPNDVSIVAANTWQRISGTLDLSSYTGLTAVIPFLYDNRSGVAGRTVKFDGLMIEPQVGQLTAPSLFVPGAAGRAARAAQGAALAAQTAADAAAVDAATANTALADIASDSLLTPGEKPTVIQNRDRLTGEQAGIDAQATAYGITTEKTNYDTDVSDLTTYLATLTSAVLWTSLAGNTTIVGATFRQKFLDVYATRQVLLNKIYASAKALADTAQAAAAAAQTAADAANADLAEIASDSLLTPDEKPRVIRDRDQITNEQAGIDAQATTYGVTTEKTTYDTAVSALTTYLATLTTPVLWTSLAGNTTIVGATFRTKFLDVFAARQTLLQKIADVVTYGNTAGSGVNMMWDNYSRFLLTTVPDFVINTGTITNIADTNTAGGRAIRVTTSDAVVTGAVLAFGTSLLEYNLPLTQNQSYIVSFRAKASVSGHLIMAQLLDDGAGQRNLDAISLTTSWVRYSASLNVGVTGTSKMLMRLYLNRSAVSGRTIDIDSIMVEPQVGSQTTPSPYVPGNPQRMASQGIVDAAAASAAAVTAQSAANAAQTDATAANADIANIASDALLTPGEKPTIIKDRDEITNGQAGIDAQATAYGITTEKTTYDTAITNLNSYLAGLTTAVLWSNLTGNTTIVGATFRTKFLDVYTARTALLNKIYNVAKAIADAAQTTADTKTKTFYQTTTPTATTVGDYWYNKNTMTLARWDGTVWVQIPDVANGIGTNILPNPTFASNNVGAQVNIKLLSTEVACDGWYCSGGEAAATATTHAKFNAGNLYSAIGDGAIANGVTIAPQFRAIDPIPVEPGKKYNIGFNYTSSYNATLPGSGYSCLMRMTVQWLNATLAVLSSSILSQVRTAAGALTGDYTAPTTAKFALVYLDSYFLNSTGSTYTPGAGTVVLTTIFTSAWMNRKYGLDADIDDGTTYGRFDILDGYTSGGTRRMGLRFGLSGHRLGDQRNMIMTRTGSTGSRWSGAAITYSIPTTGSPATVTISVASGTLQAGSVAVAYNAGNNTVSQARSTTVTYFIYYIDASYAGGTKTVNITTDGMNLTNADDRVWVGTVTITTPAVGTGGSGGGEPGGGCVEADMWIDGTRQANGIVKGDWIDIVKYDRGKLMSVAVPVLSNKIKIEPCVRLVTVGGAQVIASETTPMTLRDGTTVLIAEMLGREVVVDQDGVLRWELVTECSVIDNRPVCYISVGGESYFAGTNPRYRIATHNPLKP